MSEVMLYYNVHYSSTFIDRNWRPLFHKNLNIIVRFVSCHKFFSIYFTMPIFQQILK